MISYSIFFSALFPFHFVFLSYSTNILLDRIFKKITPEQYLSHLLNQDVRSDGRSVSEFREIVINDNCISTANGSAIVRAGENVFVCGIKAEIAEPFENSPNEGWIVPNLELSPLCSSKFKPGPPSDLAQVVSQELHQTLQQYVSNYWNFSDFFSNFLPYVSFIVKLSFRVFSYFY